MVKYDNNIDYSMIYNDKTGRNSKEIMKLFLKNVGKIERAYVEINGITIIAGENNTGKSTVGRALYSVFNSFYNLEEQIQNEKKQSVENIRALRVDEGENVQKTPENPHGYGLCGLFYYFFQELY